MPKIRQRGQYVQDQQTRSRRYNSKINHERGEEGHETCKKSYKGHKSLMAGIFTTYCPHGRCTPIVADFLN